MKEHPILFNGEMVRAIIEGRKTQTRRVIKPMFHGYIDEAEEKNWKLWPLYEDEYGDWHCQPCPYGEPGDKLWVRETWSAVGTPHGNYLTGEGCKYFYKATDPNADVGWWKPSIHMPRCASRINLLIKEIRVERIQDISKEDAIAEGILGHGGDSSRALTEFMVLWNKINNKRGLGWNINPWVWVINFEKIE